MIEYPVIIVTLGDVKRVVHEIDETLPANTVKVVSAKDVQVGIDLKRDEDVAE